ncbi:DNA-processing protein DprA [Nanoarchaeota archaeon]
MFDEFFPDNPDKRESLFHGAAVCDRVINIGSDKSDNLVKKLLEEKTFEEIYTSSGKCKERTVKRIARQLESIPFEFKLIKHTDEDFPEGLKREKCAPAIYTRGDINLLKKKSFAVVGTRKRITEDDRLLGKLLTLILSEKYVIVSGLAYTCDTIAHEAAIQKGKTIAVLAKPLNKPYPSENEALHETIGRDHLLVSQFPFGIKTYGSHFVSRDLTQACLATEGVVILHAPDNSGTKHASKHAFNQGKPIYALPSNFRQNYNWITKFNAKTVEELLNETSSD